MAERPGARYFPDPSLSHQLVPLFEVLGADAAAHVARLACCSKGWSAALDAWRATETKIVREEWIESPKTSDDWYVICVPMPVRTIMRKYPQLWELKVERGQVDLLQLAQSCKALRRVSFDDIVGADLVTLAQATKLRSIHVSDGLDGPSLVDLAQACPLLEELVCDAPRRFCKGVSSQACPSDVTLITREIQPFTDEGVLTLANCPALRKLNLKGCWNISNDAVLNLVQHCPKLEELGLSTRGCYSAWRGYNGGLTQENGSLRTELKRIRPSLVLRSTPVLIKIVLAQDRSWADHENGIFLKFRETCSTPLSGPMEEFLLYFGMHAEDVDFFVGKKNGTDGRRAGDEDHVPANKQAWQDPIPTDREVSLWDYGFTDTWPWSRGCVTNYGQRVLEAEYESETPWPHDEGIFVIYALRHDHT